MHCDSEKGEPDQPQPRYSTNSGGTTDDTVELLGRQPYSHVTVSLLQSAVGLHCNASNLHLVEPAGPLSISNHFAMLDELVETLLHTVEQDRGWQQSKICNIVAKFSTLVVNNPLLIQVKV